MSVADNKKALRNVFELFGTNPQEVAPALIALCHPDVVVKEAPGFDYGGIYRGIDGLVTAIGKAGAHVSDMTKMRVETIVGDGDHVIARFRMPWEMPPEPPGEALISEWYTFDNGKIVTIEPFFWDLYGRQ